MATARLHPLPLLLVDIFLLTTQVLAAGIAGKVSEDFFIPIVDLDGPRVAGAALLASGPGDIFKSRRVLAASEKSSDEASAPSPGDSKAAPNASKTPKTEKSIGASSAVKAPAARKSAAATRAPESRASAKPAAPTEKPQEQEVPDGKSPSILQMLEGHETELLVAGAIALAFFVIGWICGGNYYVRRDRRRRTKLRF
jgi:hypothetical protein